MNDQSISVPDLVEVAWRRKWLAAACVILALITGGIFLVLAEPIYEINAQILVAPQQVGLIQQKSSEVEPGFVLTQAEIVASPTVIAGALQCLSSSVDPDELSVVGTDVEHGLDDKMAINAILDELSVKALSGTNVLSVQYRTPDPDLGVQTVNAILAAYRAYHLKLDRDSHSETLEVLTRSEKQQREDLQAQYQKLRDESSSIGPAQSSIEAQWTMLEGLGQRLIDLRVRQAEIRQQLAETDSPIDMSTSEPVPSHAETNRTPITGNADATILREPDVKAVPTPGRESTRILDSTALALANLQRLGAPQTAAIEERLMAARARESHVSQVYGPKHPELRAVRQEIADLESQLMRLVNAAPPLLQRELSSLKHQEQHLVAVYDTEFKKLKTLDLDSINDEQLRHDIQRIHELHHETLVQINDLQLADAAVAEGRGGVKVSVLEAPNVSMRPVWPNRNLVLGVCGLLGLIGAFSISVGMERSSSNRLRTEADVAACLNTPVLGRIPTISGSEAHAVRGALSSLVYRKPDSEVAEAFRVLRTRLVNGSSATSRGIVIQLSSPAAREGKTTVATNLAFSLAQLAKRVAVVDADLRQGTLHQVFQVSNSHGLSSVLTGQSELPFAIQQSPLAPIDVLSRGPNVSNPADLLAQAGMSRIIDTLRRQYELVLVDTPPLLTFAESSMLVHLVDGVLLNVAVGHSTLSDTARAEELLRSLGANVLGVVVSKTPRARISRG